MAENRAEGIDTANSYEKPPSSNASSMLTRKRLHPSTTGDEGTQPDDTGDLVPSTKRSPSQEGDSSDAESVVSGPGAYSPRHSHSRSGSREGEGPEGEERGEEGNGAESGGSLQDLPPDALLASTLPQFASQMRPYLWVEFPSATASQINAIIHSKWKALKASSLTMLSRSYIATLPESKGSCSKLVSAYILDLPDLLNLPNPLDLPDPLDLRDLGQRE